MKLLESRSRSTPSGCIEWIGPRSIHNYGVFSSAIMGRMGAHRAAWILHRGEIPNGMWVLHKCNNPPCVNPSHLYLGNHLENMSDRKKSGNYPSAENHFATQITNKDAIAIFNDKRTCRVIASDYGVARDVVHRIRSGKTYVEATGGGRSPFQKLKGKGSWDNRKEIDNQEDRE